MFENMCERKRGRGGRKRHEDTKKEREGYRERVREIKEGREEWKTGGESGEGKRKRRHL